MDAVASWLVPGAFLSRFELIVREESTQLHFATLTPFWGATLLRPHHKEREVAIAEQPEHHEGQREEAEPQQDVHVLLPHGTHDPGVRGEKVDGVGEGKMVVRVVIRETRGNTREKEGKESLI